MLALIRSLRNALDLLCILGIDVNILVPAEIIFIAIDGDVVGFTVLIRPGDLPFALARAGGCFLYLPVRRNPHLDHGLLGAQGVGDVRAKLISFILGCSFKLIVAASLDRRRAIRVYVRIT